MMKKYKSCFWQIEIICLLVGYLLTLSGSRVGAQVIPDGTLGAESSRINPINGLSKQIDGGVLRGSNLFHSFQHFNIGSGNSVYFNDRGASNIFSRVTGPTISNIDGTLGVSGNANANLFLINPNGIIFGPNARLALGGSFVGTTASSIFFGKGGIFSASNPAVSSILSIDAGVQAPIGLIFEENPGSIQLKNAHLSTQPATTLTLVGGDINIDNSKLTARLGSRLELGGIKDFGFIGLGVSRNEVFLRFPDHVKRSDISINNHSSIRSIINKMSNEALDPSEYAGARISGQIQITGHNISISNHSELAAESGLFIGPFDLKPTDITINASGLLDLKQYGSIVNLSGGNIIVQAKQISLTDKSQLINKVEAFPQYNSINKVIGVGGIYLRIDKEINLNNSLILLEIKTSQNDLSIYEDGRIPLIPYIPLPPPMSIPGFSNFLEQLQHWQTWNDNKISEVNRPHEIGAISIPANTGNLDISAKSILLSDGAQIKINTSTKLNKNATVGNIKINARESVKIIGSESGIFSRVGNSNGVAVGNIIITGNALVLKDSGQISTTVEGQVGTPYGGNINLSFQKLILLKNHGTITTIIGKSVTRVNNTGQGILISDLLGETMPTEYYTIGAGNIRIKVPDGFIAAAGNSDIQANSYAGWGGQIAIDAKDVIGLVKRTRKELMDVLKTNTPDDLDGFQLLTNDVIAISQTSDLFNGKVDVNSLNLDPGNGLNQVPKEPRATDVADSCQVSQGTEAVQFYDIGRGGLPPRPEDPLSIDLIEWSTPVSASPQSSTARAQNSEPSSKSPAAGTTRLIPPCQSH
jgi:filamentous hemagglutinin family protein